MTSVQIRPGVGMLSLFPAMNYKPWYALGEFVDNSIQSYLEHRDVLRSLHGDEFKLNIDINYVDTEVPEILVEDNAAGICLRDIDRAFTPAVRPPDKSGISQYGIGMKSAATWYSNFYTISSKALGEEVRRTVTFDIEKIVEAEIEELPVVEEPATPNEHGTRILMRELHQGIPVGRTRGKIRDYLGSIYREFIRSGEVIVRINDEPIEFFHPALLSAPYWPTDKGPDQAAVQRTWKIPVDFTLEDSWESDQAPNRPERPPRVRGWAGILQQGDTKKSGFALMWRQKVVVGAGSLAQGDEDSFRPSVVFGATTTFPFQRVIGEIDLSDLQVTTFKDQIDWRSGQYEEFLDKLNASLREGEEPLLKMARNYRSTAKTPEARNLVKESADATAAAAAQSFKENQIAALPEEIDIEDQPSNESELEYSLTLPAEGDWPSIDLRVTVEPGAKWLKVVPGVQNWSIEVNRAHPFMNSFANIPGADLDPVLRLAMAVALTEIRLKTRGEMKNPQVFRFRLNEILSGALSERQDADG